MTVSAESRSGVWSGLGQFLLGRRLPSSHELRERLSNLGGLAVLASDPLSSVAYATEELLLVLVLAGTGALGWSVPLSLAIVGLLAILTISYRQTIRAYPQGGGAYNVARENLGTKAGLVAASGLLIDYVLTAAVSVAAAVAALTSAFPALGPLRVSISIAVLFFLMAVNLRGIKTTGRVFTVPTLFFVAIMVGLILAGVGRFVLFGSAPSAAPSTAVDSALSAVTMFLLFRAFAAGCAALTGVEAIANSVGVFRPPETRNAARTMLWMAIIMAVLFVGVTYLAHQFEIVPRPNETVVSQVARVVFEDTPLYYAVQIATVLILILAANTAFSGFPRVASVLGKDGYVPRQLSDTGRRLVFSNGIVLLAVLASVLVFVVGANVHDLIPLYAVGVFISFTLSQSGMVRHWYRLKGQAWLRSAFVNGLGACVTATALLIIAVTKFTHGAWLIILLVPTALYVFNRIHRHYEMVADQLSLDGFQTPDTPMKHTVVIPVSGVHRATLEAVAYARALSGDVRAVYVAAGEAGAEELREKWRRYVPDIPLEVIQSPYRLIVSPFLRYLDQVRSDERQLVTVVIPEFVPFHWWEMLLHSQSAWMFRVALLFRRRVAFTSVHHHLTR
ncbi:MAG: APC family permease [Chloroflexi bacterium]|nr:APC family permease [Chloroflexota bacterium]